MTLRSAFLRLAVPAAGVLLATGGCGDDPAPFANRPPRIREIVVFPESVVLEGETRITALASDEDGDPVTYAWRAEAGSFSSTTTPSTFWRGPNQPGAYWVVVEVSDGEETVADSVQVLAGEGSIYVTSDPPGANVILDGAITSITTPHLYERVAIGPHRIEITSAEFAYGSSFRDVITSHGAADSVAFEIADPTLFVLDLGRDDFEEIGSLTYLRSGTGVIYTARTTALGEGIYSSAITPATGQANAVLLSTNVNMNEPVGIIGDDAWLVWTAQDDVLQAAPIVDPERDGTVNSLGAAEVLRVFDSYGVATRFPDRIAIANNPTAEPAASPLFWAEFDEEQGLLGDIALATSTFGRQPSWDPGGSRMAYMLGGRILTTFVEPGVTTSPDTLATEGFCQLPAWSPWGPRHIAYVQGDDEINAFEVRLQRQGSSNVVTVFDGLFDPRDLAWSPAQRVLAIAHNPGRAQVVLLFDLPIP